MIALRRSRTAAAAGAAGVLLVLLAGCGSSPTDADEGEFCDAAAGGTWADDLDEDSDGNQIADALRSWGDQLDEVGTPGNITEKAREGFEITVDYLKGVDDEDFEDIGDASPVDDSFSTEERDKVAAFERYVDDTCRPDVPAEPTD